MLKLSSNLFHYWILSTLFFVSLYNVKLCDPEIIHDFLWIQIRQNSADRTGGLDRIHNTLLFKNGTEMFSYAKIISFIRTRTTTFRSSS